MNICVNDTSKIVEVWLTQAESADGRLHESLKPLCSKYRKNSYVVAVFESGRGNLLADTRNLILHNRVAGGDIVHEKLQTKNASAC